MKKYAAFVFVLSILAAACYFWINQSIMVAGAEIPVIILIRALTFVAGFAMATRYGWAHYTGWMTAIAFAFVIIHPGNDFGFGLGQLFSIMFCTLVYAITTGNATTAAPILRIIGTCVIGLTGDFVILTFCTCGIINLTGTALAALIGIPAGLLATLAVAIVRAKQSDDAAKVDETPKASIPATSSYAASRSTFDERFEDLL